jgi:hypothetical protein
MNTHEVPKNQTPPHDVLVERFVAWQVVVKQLLAYFEGIVGVENHTAKEFTRLCSVIEVPFNLGDHFVGKGGLQVRVTIVRCTMSNVCVVSF